MSGRLFRTQSTFLPGWGGSPFSACRESRGRTGNMPNILVCDDERDIVSALKIYLTAEGYEVFTAYDGMDAVRVTEEKEVHLILMDIMMPVMDGVEAVSRIRQEYNVPIIFLSAKGEDTDKIIGLNIGADDYITKPFNPVELVARVKAALRRYMKFGGVPSVSPSRLEVGGIVINDDEKTVTAEGEPVTLTPTEYDILKLLMASPGKVFSIKDIYRNVWGDSPYGAENTVAVHIRHLREKLEINPAEPRYLKVVWGQGYKVDGGNVK